MATCASNIYFGWGSMTVVASARPSLRKVASLLDRHKSLTLSIEAHCGLEARFAMPIPGQARSFTRDRADAVRVALMREAQARASRWRLPLPSPTSNFSMRPPTPRPHRNVSPSRQPPPLRLCPAPPVAPPPHPNHPQLTK